MFNKAGFTNEELEGMVVKPVHLHVGERATLMLLGIMEVGYTVHKDCVLSKETSTSYHPIKVNMAKIYVTRVGNEFYQLLHDRDGFHLYLPSVVDSDEKVWKGEG